MLNSEKYQVKFVAAANGAQPDLLSEIASEMGKHFRTNTVSMNYFTFIFYLVIGIMMLVSSASGWLQFGA